MIKFFLVIIALVHDTKSSTVMTLTPSINTSLDSQDDRPKRGILYNDFSSRGYYCMGSCQKIGTSYFWCRVNSGDYSWDYCSYSGVDYYGRRCKGGCDYRGEKYRWCYLEQGSWGYCSGYGSAASTLSFYSLVTLLSIYFVSFIL